MSWCGRHCQYKTNENQEDKYGEYKTREKKAMKPLPPTKHGFKIIPKNLRPNKDRATRVVIPSNSAIYRRLQKKKESNDR